VTTPLDILVAGLGEASGYNAAAESPPEAILWCDANRDFLPLLPSLRERLPHLLTYGDFDAATRTGPAVWLRAAVARALPDLSLPENAAVIVYLPGIGREILRGAEDCPPLLQPLVWFTVAGNLFGHVNGKDWTIRGFLAAERGKLKLEIDEDQATRTALAHAAVRFCTRPIEELRGKRWDADALNALLAPDLATDMLDWMDGTFDATAAAGRFAAFVGLAGKELGFDPSKLSRQDAARRLAQREGKWPAVWTRFASSTGYDGVVRLLAAEEPPSLLADKGAYPRVNARDEKKLRDELLQLINLPLAETRSRIQALDHAHAWRRETVWARRGEAPLAVALKHLTEISAAKALPTHEGTALAQAYVQFGWAVDWAALKAIAAVPREVDRTAITTALRAVYIPWLDEGATALQELVRQGKVQLAKPEKRDNPGTLLFVDGLRIDLAHQLIELLRAEGAQIDVGWTWSGFPTVTATCKPLVSPIAEHLRGSDRASDLAPVTGEGKAATKPTLFKGMEDAGWQTDDSLLTDTKLWVEAGRFDEEGHALGARLADRIVGGVRDIADRALGLLRSGRRIRIVTDHGWLLVPGGLPQAILDPGLVEPQGKRSRCAIVKSAAQTSYLQVPWTWNGKVSLASATGARAFFAGQEYAHGGISPQECVLPVLDVSVGAAAAQPISIMAAKWEGLRLRVEVAGGADRHVDLRLGAETSGATLIKGGRVLDEKGRTSVLVNDLHEGKQACLVVLDDNGAILAHRVLTIGGD
jgi:hypothetical protein